MIATDPQVPDVQTTTALTAPTTAQTGVAVALTANLTPADAPERCRSRKATIRSARGRRVANGVAAIQHTSKASGVHSITASSPPVRASRFPSSPQSVQCPDPAPVTW
ncbi:hypothetical protein GS416_07630 [Rhodococcus hoagii]|nr:hypothetical protein [Prescottella equi]